MRYVLETLLKKTWSRFLLQVKIKNENDYQSAYTNVSKAKKYFYDVKLHVTLKLKKGSIL